MDKQYIIHYTYQTIDGVCDRYQGSGNIIYELKNGIRDRVDDEDLVKKIKNSILEKDSDLDNIDLIISNIIPLPIK